MLGGELSAVHKTKNPHQPKPMGGKNNILRLGYFLVLSSTTLPR